MPYGIALQKWPSCDRSQKLTFIFISGRPSFIRYVHYVNKLISCLKLIFTLSPLSIFHTLAAGSQVGLRTNRDSRDLAKQVYSNPLILRQILGDHVEPTPSWIA